MSFYSNFSATVGQTLATRCLKGHIAPTLKLIFPTRAMLIAMKRQASVREFRCGCCSCQIGEYPSPPLRLGGGAAAEAEVAYWLPRTCVRRCYLWQNIRDDRPARRAIETLSILRSLFNDVFVIAIARPSPQAI